MCAGSVVSFLLLFQMCLGGYELNDTEYQEMPPLFALDDYVDCLMNNDTFCLSTMVLHADEPYNNVMKMIHNYSAVVQKHYNHSIIDRGICIKRTCGKFVESNINKTADLGQVLEACVNESTWKNFGLQSKLSHIHYCSKGFETVTIDFKDIFVALMFIIFVVLNVVGSIYDLHVHKQSEGSKTKGNRYLLSFSVFRNWAWLTTTELKDSRLESLRGLHGVKTISTILVILVHIIVIYGTGYTVNPHDFEKAYESFQYRFIFNGMMLVNVFFVMSGFLLVYKLELYSEKKKVTWRTMPMILLQRFLRITPAYAIVIAFSATWFRHMGSGPLWKFFVNNQMVSDCNKYWWAHMLYIQNYFPDDKLCSAQSWYLAVDMQMTILGLIVYIATKNRGRNLALGVLLVIGLMAPVLHVWLQDLDAITLMFPEFFRTLNNDSFRKLHVLGHNNISNLVIGMYIGYFLYSWQKNDGKPRRNYMYRIIGLCVIPTIFLVVHTGSMFYTDGEKQPLVVRMLYTAVHRLIIAGAAAIGIVGLVMKFDDTVRGAFEWRGWVVPGRLSFCVYLIHFNIIFVLLGIKKHLTTVSYFYMIIAHLGVTIASFLIAVPLYLMVEAPISRLIKEIIHKRDKKREKQL